MTISLPVSIIAGLVFAVGAPFLGGLINGADRIITARMQKRVGPPLLQPFYDVAKLFGKDVIVNKSERVLVASHLACVIAAGVVFFAVGNFLMVVLLVSLASLFLILAGFSTRSPYADLGAQREALQVMAYEPMLLLAACGIYLATGTFNVQVTLSMGFPLVVELPLIFAGLVFVLTIKLRKSPFDISMSHHAHQEIVRGVTTEMSGTTLALTEISHWYETVLFLGWVAAFLIWGSPVGVIVCLLCVAVVYFLEILVDNNFARVRFQSMIRSSWWVSLVLGSVNLAVIPIINVFCVLGV